VKSRLLAMVPSGFALAILLGCPGGPETLDVGGSYPTYGDLRENGTRASLKVHTATFVDLNLADDEGTMIRHTGYTIYDELGHQVMYVRNFVGVHDREPTTVDLIPGKYLILLDNPERQVPIFWVQIDAGKLTVVSLPK